MASDPASIPENYILDVHDLCALILDAHVRTEPLFAHAKVVEINHGNAPPTTFPEQFFHPSWHEIALEQTHERVAYILKLTPPHKNASLSIPSLP